MTKAFPFPLLEPVERLARFGGWSEEVYRDLRAYGDGQLDEAALRRKYCRTVAILQLDMTGMTEAAMRGGALVSFLRILNAQQVCAPVLLEHGATHVRAFADDFTAIFPVPGPALDAALGMHQRMTEYNAAQPDPALRVECCIGLGYGEVFTIGLDGAMGDEMNRASKLGEDTAAGGETLLTENFHAHVRHRGDCRFERREHPEVPFPFFAVRAR
jgi:class 3 adenylate cyclase